jgi:carbonic anhydrase
MSDVVDELLAHNEAYAASFDAAGLPTEPRRRLAIVACMDSRMDLFAMLGLQVGEAHVIRNAGGVVTADTIRSLAISQRLLGTRQIMLIHHTRCGMLSLTEDGFKRELEQELGIRPEWAIEAFDDVDANVRQSAARIASSPFIPHKDGVRGFVYEVETGRLREVV